MCRNVDETKDLRARLERIHACCNVIKASVRRVGAVLPEEISAKQAIISSVDELDRLTVEFSPIYAING